MKIIKTNFKDLIIVKNISYRDNRGYFKELMKENNLKKKFPFIVMSYSKRNVVRGLHLQINESQGKFISVIKGKIFDVALDLRKNSKTFGKYFTTYIDEKNSNSIYIPPGFAHGFQALNKENYVVYACTKYRNKNSEVSINPIDKILKIKWPNKTKIISKRDKKAMSYDRVLKIL